MMPSEYFAANGDLKGAMTRGHYSIGAFGAKQDNVP
jgi:hypothetical protein